MNFHVLAYETSQGPMIWIYSNQVTAPSAGGLIVCALMGLLFVWALATESMMAAMTPAGVFFFFGSITLTGFLFVYCFIIDTAGLTEKERKELYA